MSEESTGKNEPVWMQGHVAHASMQLGAQPIAELKLFMHPKPSATMHPHLSQFSYIFQERPPGKPPGKGEAAQVFWVKSDQPPQQSMSGSKDKMKDHDLSSNESHDIDSPSLLAQGPSGAGTTGRSQRPHSAERQYKCKECGKAFPQPSHLVRHSRTHTGEQPYKCDLCGRAFADQSHRLRHLRTHIGVRTHKCDECGKEFFEPNHLVRHARRHSGERPFPCDQCGKAFCEQSGLTRHLRTHAPAAPTDPRASATSFKHAGSSPPEGTPGQPLAGAEAVRKGPEEPSSTAKVESVWMQGPMAVPPGHPLGCPPPHFLAPLVAGPEPSVPFFAGPVQGPGPLAEVKLVMAPKAGIQPPLSLSQISSILQQERSPGKVLGSKEDPTHLFWVKPDHDTRRQSPQNHQSAQPSLQQGSPQQVSPSTEAPSSTAAQHCSNSSSSSSSRSSTDEISPGSGAGSPEAAADVFRCKACGKLFSQAHHLVRHARTHTGEQPFRCDVCGRSFADESHRLRHLRTHIGVRKHRCDECGKEFFEHNHLRRHAKRHRGDRPWRCDRCDKAFCEESGLKKHALTHAAERPFKCALCGRGFFQRSEAARHAATHTGRKAFACDVCAKAFADRHGLNKHLRTHLKVSQTHRCQVLWSSFHPGAQ